MTMFDVMYPILTVLTVLTVLLLLIYVFVAIVAWRNPKLEPLSQSLWEVTKLSVSFWTAIMVMATLFILKG